MTDTAATGPVQRRRFRRGLIVAVILLMPLAIHAVWDQIESTLLARDIAAIARRGEPVNVVHRRQALTDPELRRSAAFYAAAADLARSQSVGFAFENKDIEDHSTDALFDANTLSTYLADSEPALHLLDSATPLRFSGFGAVAPGLYANQSPLQALNAMNCVSADALSARGDGDAAADALVRSIRLQRAVPSPFNRNFTLRRLYGSFRILLAHAQPGSESLRRLQAAMEQLPDEDGMLDEILQHRAEMLGEFWPYPVERGSWALRPQEPRRMSIARTLGFVMFRPLLTHALRRQLHPYEEVLAVARQPWPDKLDASARLLERYRGDIDRASRTRWTTGWASLPPSLALFDLGWLPAAGANLAMRRTAIIVFAIERYRRDHGGAPPEALQALVPGYLSAIPSDPFSGQPPVFRVAADSYAVYSLDINRKDDGAALYGIGTGTKERWLSKDTTTPADLGIRVPLAGQR